MSAETIPFAPSPNPALFDPPYLPPGGMVMSVDDYRQLVRTSEIRYEYVDFYAIPKDGVEILENGEVRAMSGSSPSHNRIALNISAKLDAQIGESPCEVYISDIRVRVSAAKYRYPDVVALCGEAQFDADTPPCLLNPSVIVEVLSPSTQSVDIGEKFDEYKQIPTLTDYVLVAQNRMFMTHYVRQSAVHWTLMDYEQPSNVLTFSTLGVSISLAEIYRKIVFAPSA